MRFGHFATAVAAAFTLVAGAGSASAQALYVAPGGYAAAEGTASTQLPLGNGGAPNVTAQFLFGTSQLGGLQPGSLITGIGFRVNSNSLAPNAALNYSYYQISLGGSTQAVGGLTTDFAANQAANTSIVRSGALTIPVGSFTATPSSTGTVANPFFSIAFATPYSYTGSDLLVTLQYATTGTSGLVLDGVPLSVGGLDSVSNINPQATYAQLYNVPVIQFTTAAVAAAPEPATWALMIVGFGIAGSRLRSARRSQARGSRNNAIA